MAGNVWEWCRDWLAPYDALSVTDPLGPSAPPKQPGARVLRGGSFRDSGEDLRAAFRIDRPPDMGNLIIGFRLVSSRLRR